MKSIVKKVLLILGFLSIFIGAAFGFDELPTPNLTSILLIAIGGALVVIGLYRKDTEQKDSWAGYRE